MHFAASTKHPDKARQQAIYDDVAPDVLLELPYRDLEAYRSHCARLTELIRSRGVHGPQLKALKTRLILDRLSPASKDRVLDIGCGAGSTLALLTLRYGVLGTGVDISSTVIERCLQVNPWGHDYYQADAEELPFLDNTFDAIVSLDVLEHLPHPEQCIAEAARVLRPGGWALFYAISQRDAYTWHWTQRRLSGGAAGVDNGAGHSWDGFLQPERSRLWMERAGFAEVRSTPFHAMATLIFDERFTSLLAGIIRAPWLLRLLLALSDLVDLPLTSRGFGNGFYVVGRKATEARHRGQ